MILPRHRFLAAIALFFATALDALLYGQSNLPQLYSFTTLAGGGGSGSVDGMGAAAQFSLLHGMTIDNLGNIYVTDEDTSFQGPGSIRKVTPAGLVTTLARLPGIPRIPSSSHPVALAVDGSGNIFVVDDINNMILKVSPTGVVTPFAGNTTANPDLPRIQVIFGTIPDPSNAGYTDGPTTLARFDYPEGIAVDSVGNVYVTDNFNHAIRKIDPSGNVTTLAGGTNSRGIDADGTGSAAFFGGINGIAIDTAGNLYVADFGLSTIRKVTPAGVVTTIAGTIDKQGSADGQGTAAKFNNPQGIAVDKNNNVFVADSSNHTLRKISPTGLVTTIGGLSGNQGTANGTAGLARFNGPFGIAVDQSGILYVGDSAVRKGVTVPAGQLINISTRSFVGTGPNIQIAGFVVTGSQPKQVLIRGSGPALDTIAPSLVGLTLPDPTLQLFQGSNPLYMNTGWATASNAADIKTTAARLGAFAWTDGSPDSALLVTLPPGPYTAQVSGHSSDSGLALVEVYDADATPSTRLINISTRSLVEKGSNIQIAGFVIPGDQPKKVLIRAAGPALASQLSGTLPDPVLWLFTGQSVVATNAGWSLSDNADDIKGVASIVGAAPWAQGSKDSALLITLQPGPYTVQVSGQSGDSGIALVEVYDADL